jgi:hypothetical protein
MTAREHEYEVRENVDLPSSDHLRKKASIVVFIIHLQKTWEEVGVKKVYSYTVIHFVSYSAKFGICTVLGLNGTLAELKYALETL